MNKLTASTAIPTRALKLEALSNISAIVSGLRWSKRMSSLKSAAGKHHLRSIRY